jgi:hypothetical protein
MGGGGDGNLFGGGGDALVGSAGNDLQVGGDGSDEHCSTSRADTLDAGAGKDLVAGPGARDTFSPAALVSPVGDVIGETLSAAMAPTLRPTRWTGSNAA